MKKKPFFIITAILCVCIVFFALRMIKTANRPKTGAILVRVRDGFRAGLKLVWMLCLPIVALYLLGGRMLVNIFMNEPSEAAMASGVQFLRIVSPFYFLVSCKLVSDGVLRGAGLMKEFMVATFTDLILRVGLAIGLSKVLGVTGVWCAWPIGWTIAMVLSVLFYRRGPWEKQKA